MVWPLEPDNIINFVDGSVEVLVIEEKRSIIEDQLMKYLYNYEKRPLIIGKKDENGDDLIPSEGELSPSSLSLIIANRIQKLSLDIDLSTKIQSINMLIAKYVFFH